VLSTWPEKNYERKKLQATSLTRRILNDKVKTMTTIKSTEGICVYKLTYYFPDKDDNKIYEYTGDHSSFCDGIDPKYLKEINV